nr:CYP71E22 [Avena strigosa]
MVILHPSQLLLAQLPQWQLLLVLLLPLLLSLVLAARSRNGLRLPPGPAPLPVLGNLHQLGALPHRSMRELARRHGPVMLLRLGMTRLLVVSSPSAAREVLKAHDAACCTRPACPGANRLSYGFKSVAFAPYGETWREMRGIFMADILSARRVRDAWAARQEQADRIVAALALASGKPVPLGEHVFAFIHGVMGTAMLGNVLGAGVLAVAGEEKRFQLVLDEAMDIAATFTAEDFFPNAAGRLVDRLTGIVGRRDRIFADLDGFFETIVEQHLDPARPRKPEDGGDLVDVLVGLWRQGSHGLTRDHIKGIIMDTFVGGIDATSVTILWAMSELTRGAVADGRRARPDDMPKLSYLRMVVKETLRLYPPATLLLPRETMRHVSIGGYDVPAGTRVAVNAWAIGRDPASWGDGAEELDPDRFAGGEVDLHGAHLELVPFGSGRRLCPGRSMALMNVEFALATMLCAFDWTLPEGTKAEELCMEETGGLTFHRKTPLLLVPTLYVPPRA